MQVHLKKLATRTIETSKSDSNYYLPLNTGLESLSHFINQFSTEDEDIEYNGDEN